MEKQNKRRQAIDEAMKMCISCAQFKKIMLKKGYIINDDYNRKYPTIRTINDKKAVRMYQLGEEYLPENIAYKVNQNPYYMQNDYYDFIKPKKKSKQYNVYKFNGSFKDIKKMSGIDVMFLLLYHLLGLLPKKNNYKPLSPEMQKQVRKLEQYSKQTILIVTEKLKTTEDIKSYISQTESNIEKIADLRQKYRNKLRNCKNNNLILEYKNKRDECTLILNKYRGNLKTANYILEDIPKIKEVIKIEQQMKRTQDDIQKTKMKDRYVR